MSEGAQLLVVGLAATVILLLLLGLSASAKGVDSLGVYLVSAYCPCPKCCGPRARGVTADGTRITPGMRLLAAPPEIPLGTMLVVPGYGEAPVRDRGGSIQGRRLDVLFAVAGKDGKIDLPASHEAAVRWGVRIVEVRRPRP